MDLGHYFIYLLFSFTAYVFSVQYFASFRDNVEFGRVAVSN